LKELNKEFEKETNNTEENKHSANDDQDAIINVDMSLKKRKKNKKRKAKQEDM